MNSFEAVEMLFQKKSPDHLGHTGWSGKLDFQPACRVFANRFSLSETPFSGQHGHFRYNRLWVQEIFFKKVAKKIFPIQSTEFPRPYCFFVTYSPR
jgi:hypothetical protein